MTKQARKISKRWIEQNRVMFREFLDETEFPDPERAGQRGYHRFAMDVTGKHKTFSPRQSVMKLSKTAKIWIDYHKTYSKKSKIMDMDEISLKEVRMPTH
jgi:hypothetical protein